MANSFNKCSYTAKRETSQYNKRMKWHLETFRGDGGSLYSSQYFKTQKEMNQHIERMIYRGKEGFPIGNYLSFTEYTQI